MDEPIKQPSLAQRAVRGALWSVATSIGGRAVGLVATLVITRFVAPAAYGEVSTAFVVVWMVSFLTAPGMGQYVVARREAGRVEAFHATFYHVLLGVLGIGGLWIASRFVPQIPKLPDLILYLPGLCVAAMIERVAYMPGRVLAKQMRFKVLGLRMLLGELVYAGVGVTLAWRGHGAWAVLWAMVMRSAVTGLLVIVSVHPREWLAPTPLRRDTTRTMLRFGVPLWLSSALAFLSRRGDNLLIAALFGAGPVGHYNLAYNLADLPATQVGEQIGDVLLPSFTRVKEHKARERALVRASGLLSLVVFPLAIGLGAIAHTLVDAIFDERWAPVAPMLMVLSALSILRPLGWLIANYLQALDRTRTVLALEGLRAGAVVIFVLGLGQLGVLWACAGIGLAFGAATIASGWVLERADGLRLSTLLRPLARPLIACAPMIGAILLMRQAFGGYPWLWLGVILELAIGAIVYVGAALAIAGEQSRDLLSLLRDALARRR